MFTTISPPKHCPACGSDLQWEKDELYCRNPVCGAQAAKRVEHFCKTLKIKGFGPATVENLGISSIPELYTEVASEDDLAERLGCSDKVAKKLYAELDNSKKADLASILAALSIPLIGRSKAADIANVVDSIYDIDEAACAEAGLGPKATTNLLTWLENDFWDLNYSQLPFSYESSKEKEQPKTKETVCISGKLSSFKTKAEATKALEEQGYVVKSSVTKDVTILINESGIESSKTKKARESGITIIENTKDLLGV